jgi:type IV secretion system protein VirB10
MRKSPRRSFSSHCVLAAVALFLLPQLGRAQEPPGPQAAPPPPVTPPQPAAQQPPASPQPIRIPAGTHVAVVLENGISTGSAKAGDSVYFHTSFPITQDNHIVIPVGSYLRGELIESKRPGKVKGRGEFRMRLDTLIFPNGYTVDLNATPRSADTGGKETMDSEGKVTSAGGKGQDVKTVAETTATGAGIGAIADGPKGLGIGAGIGAVAGLGAVLLTRGPEAQLPRGSALDVVLEHELTLDRNQIRYSDSGRALPITPPPASH